MNVSVCPLRQWTEVYRRKMEEEEAGKVHIVVVPFPDGQGHINPILQFSKRLASKGLKVSVLHVHETSHSSRSNEQLGSITVEHRARVPYKGREDQPESLDSHLHRLQTSTCFHLTNLITHHRTASASRPIGCVVYDSLTPWILDVARGFGLPGAPFFTESCAVNAVFYHINRGSLTFPIAADRRTVSLPGLPVLRIEELPSLVTNLQQYPGVRTLLINQFCNEPDWMFINTFHALEPQVLEWMQSRTSLKTVGPTVPSVLIDKELKDDNHYGMDLIKSTEEDNNIISWLDSKEQSSVIYVSFGSFAKLGEEQMEELAWGLKAANKTFLWVIKESETPKLPLNYILLEEMGMVVKWCPQVQVLGHSSVGCFVSHCGWNSVLEALSSGVPVVAMPQWTDQMTNAKFVEDVWKIGVRVTTPNENEIVGRKEIELCIKQVMEGQKGLEIAQNATKWKSLAKEAFEISEKNIDEFVAQLTSRKI